MTATLVHRSSPDSPPVGVWWLPGHRARPQSLYVKDSYFTQGALLVLGLGYRGEGVPLGEWDSNIERLVSSSNPLSHWSVVEVDDPASALLPTPPPKS